MREKNERLAPPIYFLKMELAGVKIGLESTNIREFRKCKDYLSDFDLPDFTVRVSKDESEDDFRNRIIESGISNIHDGEIIGIDFQRAYKKIIQKMYSYDVFLIHGSVIAEGNRAYMFTAASGVGKTTRTRLWIEEFPNSIIVNGDKPLIKVTQSDVYACGTPWCGKEGWNTNVMVPLKAIFLLERVENEEDNAVEEISPNSAWQLLLRHVYWPSDIEAFQKTVCLLKDVVNRVKIYRFYSTPTHEAIRFAHDTVNDSLV